MQSKNKFNLSLWIMKMRTVIALIIITVVITVLLQVTRNINFLNLLNLVTVGKHVAITAILALGMTFVILTGGIDLSIGGIVGLCGMIAGGLIYEGLSIPGGDTMYLSIWAIVVAVLIIGTFIGYLNGVLITRLNVAPFIGTLGMMYIARGLANLRSGGATFPNLQGKEELGNTGFTVLGAGKFIGVPVSIWIMILLTALTIYIAKKTPLGRHIYAIGGNAKAATLSGVQVKKVTLWVYMFSGFCAGTCGG